MAEPMKRKEREAEEALGELSLNDYLGNWDIPVIPQRTTATAKSYRITTSRSKTHTPRPKAAKSVLVPSTISFENSHSSAAKTKTEGRRRKTSLMSGGRTIAHEEEEEADWLMEWGRKRENRHMHRLVERICQRRCESRSNYLPF